MASTAEGTQDIIDALIRLARALGEYPRAYSILGEGNVSARVDETTFMVKASGTSLATATASSFVGVDLARVLSLVGQPPDGDDAVATALHATIVEGPGTPGTPGTPRPSVETGMHAVLLDITGATWVAHTHAMPVTALLCSAQAEDLAAGTLFPDQAVVCGAHPLFLPYVDPGLPLARTLTAALDAYLHTYGAPPRTIYLRNHGLVAVGWSAAEVLAITDMAVKAATILTTALACGGARYLPDEEVRRIVGRPDEHYRQKILGLR